MTYSAWFECIRCRDDRYDLFTTIYTCPKCGGLLEVTHDEAALDGRDTAGWKSLFAARSPASLGADASGVWGKREWVLPGLDAADVVTLGEGWTPLVAAPRFGEPAGLPNLFIKQCGTSHTGSFKDLGMTVLVSAVKRMRRQGAPIRAVACASTGDTSAALAAYCATAGIPGVVLLPRGKISTAQLLQPLAHGAVVLELDTDFDGCMAVVKALTHDPSIYLANSMNSLRVEGQKTVAIEMAQQLGWRAPDWVVIPGGNLGNVSALGKGFLQLKRHGLIDRLPRICVAQAAAANPLYRSFQTGFASFAPLTAGTTLASAIRIGAPVSVEKAIAALRACDGVVEEAQEDELADTAAAADRAGLFACPHTAVALTAAQKLAARGAIGRDETVVVVSTAHGLKFADQKIAYHEDRLRDGFGVTARRANRPVACGASVDDVRRALDKALAAA